MQNSAGVVVEGAAKDGSGHAIGPFNEHRALLHSNRGSRSQKTLYIQQLVVNLDEGAEPLTATRPSSFPGHSRLSVQQIMFQTMKARAEPNSSQNLRE